MQCYCWLFLGTHDTLTYADFKKEIKNTVLVNAYCHLCLGTDVLTYAE